MSEVSSVQVGAFGRKSVGLCMIRTQVYRYVIVSEEGGLVHDPSGCGEVKERVGCAS